MWCLQIILGFFGSIAVAVAVDWYFLIPVIVLMVVFYLTRLVYLRSAKNIKRLEGMSMSVPCHTLHLRHSIVAMLIT